MMIQGILVIWLYVIVHDSEGPLYDPIWKLIWESGLIALLLSTHQPSMRLSYHD